MDIPKFGGVPIKFDSCTYFVRNPVEAAKALKEFGGRCVGYPTEVLIEMELSDEVGICLVKQHFGDSQPIHLRVQSFYGLYKFLSERGFKVTDRIRGKLTSDDKEKIVQLHAIKEENWFSFMLRPSSRPTIDISDLLEKSAEVS